MRKWSLGPLEPREGLAGILTQRTFMNTAGLFAGIILVILIGMLVEDVLFASIEKHTLEKWGMKAV